MRGRCVHVSVGLRVFLCLVLLCVCESHPLTAEAELFLIQFCLSCLTTTPAPDLLSPGSAPQAHCPCLGLSVSQGLCLGMRF